MFLLLLSTLDLENYKNVNQDQHASVIMGQSPAGNIITSG